MTRFDKIHWKINLTHLQRDDSDFADFFGDSDGGSFFGEIDEALKVKDPSVEYYPEPFCDMVDSELII